jgi:hypothetical protein
MLKAEGFSMSGWRVSIPCRFLATSDLSLAAFSPVADVGLVWVGSVASKDAADAGEARCCGFAGSGFRFGRLPRVVVLHAASRSGSLDVIRLRGSVARANSTTTTRVAAGGAVRSRVGTADTSRFASRG